MNIIKQLLLVQINLNPNLEKIRSLIFRITDTMYNSTKYSWGLLIYFVSNKFNFGRHKREKKRKLGR